MKISDSPRSMSNRFSAQTCKRPWVVHGAYESAPRIHSRTIFWYRLRAAATQVGSLTEEEGKSVYTEKRSESKQEEFHKTCNLWNLQVKLVDTKYEKVDN